MATPRQGAGIKRPIQLFSRSGRAVNGGGVAGSSRLSFGKLGKSADAETPAPSMVFWGSLAPGPQILQLDGSSVGRSARAQSHGGLPGYRPYRAMGIAQKHVVRAIEADDTEVLARHGHGFGIRQHTSQDRRHDLPRPIDVRPGLSGIGSRRVSVDQTERPSGSVRARRPSAG